MRNFLIKHYQNLRIQKEKLKGIAAVASKTAAEIYNLHIIENEIQTRKQNYTRFFVLKKRNGKLDRSSIVYEINSTVTKVANPLGGGIYIEVLKDIQSALAPVSKNEALKMIHNLKSYKIIEGIRNQKDYTHHLPSNRKMDLSAKYIPRHAIGGDYYDFIPLGDDEYIICIADVSGKGVSAALLMANFQVTIRTLFKYQRFEMPFLIEELNKKVMRSAKGEKFITFFIAHYNAHTRHMKYVNAGHNHPFILHGRKIFMLDKGCIGLGMLDEIPKINVGSIELSPNSTFVLYTDGLIELENNEGTLFGVNQLVKAAQAYAPLKMEDMNNIIFSKLDDWRGDLSFVDDTAIFSCKFF